MQPREPRDRTIHALDYRTLRVATEAATSMRNFTGPICKIGPGLFLRHGPAAVVSLQSTFGFQVFLDMKFNDTPETVFEASMGAAELGVAMFTVHCDAGLAAMKAACEGVGEAMKSRSGHQQPIILGVIMLTSKTDADLERDGLIRLDEDAPPRAYVEVFEEVVMRRALMAKEVGFGGLVVSPRFVKYVRKACPNSIIVTPGIHAVETAYQAIWDGADYLVIGRLFRQTSKRRPFELALEIEAKIRLALEEKGEVNRAD